MNVLVRDEVMIHLTLNINVSNPNHYILGEQNHKLHGNMEHLLCGNKLLM